MNGFGLGTSTDNIDAQTNSILDFWQKYKKNEIILEVKMYLILNLLFNLKFKLVEA